MSATPTTSSDDVRDAPARPRGGRPGRAGTPPMPGLLRTSFSRTRMELRETLRARDAVVFTLALPVVLLVIFGTVLDQPLAPGVSFADYFTAGIAASGILLVSFQSLAIDIAVARDTGHLRRLEGTPMPRSAYFLGKVGLVLVTGVLQLAVLLVTARVLFDVPFPVDASAWLTLGWVAALGAAAGTLLGIAYSSVPSSARSASAVVAPVVLVLQFVSGVFFLFSDLPGWMQALASVFPLRWVAQGFRSAILPDTMAAAEVSGSWQLGETALVLAAWTVVGLVLCLTTFRWRRRGDR